MPQPCPRHRLRLPRTPRGRARGRRRVPRSRTPQHTRTRTCTRTRHAQPHSHGCAGLVPTSRPVAGRSPLACGRLLLAVVLPAAQVPGPWGRGGRSAESRSRGRPPRSTPSLPAPCLPASVGPSRGGGRPWPTPPSSGREGFPQHPHSHASWLWKFSGSPREPPPSCDAHTCQSGLSATKHWSPPLWDRTPCPRSHLGRADTQPTFP